LSLKRHTLVDISDAGREAILAEVAARGPISAAMRERLKAVLLPDGSGVRVPGTVRREDGSIPPGCVPVGFSDLFPNGGERLRVAAFACIEDILSVTSPYDAAALPVPARSSVMRALAAAKERAASLALPLGVWGSAAIELYTGLPCTREGSDLDLLVGPAPLEVLSAFMGAMRGLEDAFHLRIDVEVDLPSGYGVQLRELLGGGRTLLGKGLTDAALFPRAEVLAGLPCDGRAAAGAI
jgi:phosphoribosyl-dephospho-CoA transferase